MEILTALITDALRGIPVTNGRWTVDVDVDATDAVAVVMAALAVAKRRAVEAAVVKYILNLLQMPLSKVKGGRCE